MRSRLLLLLALGLFCGTVGAGADADWARLRSGMTQAEVAGMVGPAVQSNKGRGFLVGIYDRQAEVVYYRGRLMSWTPPKPVAKPQSVVAAARGNSSATSAASTAADKAGVAPVEDVVPTRLPTGGAVTRDIETAVDTMNQNHKGVAASGKKTKAKR